jgi:hypothetical protein
MPPAIGGGFATVVAVTASVVVLAVSVLALSVLAVVVVAAGGDAPGRKQPGTGCVAFACVAPPVPQASSAAAAITSDAALMSSRPMGRTPRARAGSATIRGRGPVFFFGAIQGQTPLGAAPYTPALPSD